LLSSLQHLSAKAAVLGLPLDAQRIVVMPTFVFTTEDDDLRAKLKANEVYEYASGKEHDDHMEPIHDFIPPIKQERTAEMRKAMMTLE
jgi:hypothetical protein